MGGMQGGRGAGETHNSFIKKKRGRNMSCNVFSWKESSLGRWGGSPLGCLGEGRWGKWVPTGRGASEQLG